MKTLIPPLPSKNFYSGPKIQHAQEKHFHTKDVPLKFDIFTLSSFETTQHKSLNLAADREPFIQFGIIFASFTY